ncbi:MAG TPA: glycosyl transferase family 2, partial [Porphyromonadaceae bacterium]|nr:glycosyl transferase family 2 [Porphyromonadaceae bacterium]
MKPAYSVIIPVYNRPDEINELLASLSVQSFNNFEVVIVEDGSDTPCVDVVNQFKEKLRITYFTKPNTG